MICWFQSLMRPVSPVPLRRAHPEPSADAGAGPVLSRTVNEVASSTCRDVGGLPVDIAMMAWTACPSMPSRSW